MCVTRIITMRHTALLLQILWYLFIKNVSGTQDEPEFPENFIFGASTSSYQIEGAWNIDGKGENIWDRFTHTYPERISDRSTGDVACDSYHKYKEDVKYLADMHVNFYRFSLSWTRLLPTGQTNKINWEGLRYYNNLINELLKYNITPMVTLYHWDLPQTLQDLGGWTNTHLVTYFLNYASFAFVHFGDRVKYWITFNEPKLICVYGYGNGRMAPGLNIPGIAEYLCGHTILKAHAGAYNTYDKVFRKSQNGSVGISIHTEWFEPASDNFLDIQASERKLMFDFGWFAYPILKGDYPPLLKERIKMRSKEEGFLHTRLPFLNAVDVFAINQSIDFLGLNMYTASMVAHLDDEEFKGTLSYESDVGVRVWKDPKWPSTEAKRVKVVPWAMRSLLKWINHNFGSVKIIITENGVADDGSLNDDNRVNFIHDYLSSVLTAIHVDKVNVVGYSVWSLIDNFEWFSGYKEHYGLIQVDFSSPNKTRRIKKSALCYRNIILARKLVRCRERIFSDARALTISNIIMLTSILTLLIFY